MREDRVAEVHGTGSRRTVMTENKELGVGTYSFGGAINDVVGPPGVFPLAVIPMPAYYFTIAGTERKVTEACEEYLSLLQGMVAQFKEFCLSDLTDPRMSERADPRT